MPIAHIDDIVKLRKTLHQHPEVSGSEIDTAKRILSFIEHFQPHEIIKNVGGHGLIVVYEFSQEGPGVAIRCELDALPICEVNEFDHRSLHPNISHKCGHDGHMAIVAGLAPWLQEQSFQTGRVFLIFQAAEETGKGAPDMLEHSFFEEKSIDYVFALHNIPGYEKHQIISIDSGFSAEVQSCCIHLKGLESHASEPENGINPSLACSELIAQLDQMNHSEEADSEFSILTPIHINLGQKAYGISPANAELHYTIRVWNSERMAGLKDEIDMLAKNISSKHQLTYNIDWFEYFPASKNDSRCVELIEKVAHNKQISINKRPFPFKFGEDFGWFTKRYTSAMFGLGSGINTPALHNPSYDFPDDIIPTGIQLFESLITQILQTENTSK